MKIEKLETSNNKFKYIVVGVIITAIVFILINYLTSRASYRNTQSIPLMTGTINYKVPDLNTIAMYKIEDGQQIELTEMPGAGYELDTENSYCYTTDSNTHDDVTLATDSAGNLVIGKLKKGSKCYLWFVKESLSKKTLAKLGSYTIKEETTFSGTSHETTQDLKGEKVVYKLQDNDGDTYVFRGNPDNWVTFAGMTWRIIRINGDGTLRLLYYCGSTSCSSSENVSNSAYNSSYKSNTYVGFYYGPAGASDYSQTHSNLAPSPIAAELKTWYQDNLETNYKDYLSETTGWCNDRTVDNTGAPSHFTGDGTGARGQTAYAPYGRFINADSARTPFIPKLTCNKNDLFTIPNSNNVGNQAMTQKTTSSNYVPVGLITVDEVAIGGLLYSGGGNEAGSYVSGSSNYWTMSPCFYNGSYAYVFYVYSSGYLYYTHVDLKSGVRPVINLKTDITISSGNGTSSSPFIVS